MKYCSSFGFFSTVNRNTLGNIGENNNDYLLNSAGQPITYRGIPVRKNDHIIIETDDGILIRSCGETIHLKKEDNNWPVIDELIKEDETRWTKFKEKFK